MSLEPSPAEIAAFGPPTLATLENALGIWRATTAFYYAGVTIMLWDMLLTMKMEIHLLWRSKLSFLKTTFLVNRYVAPTVICVNIYLLSGEATGLTDEVCRAWLPVSGVIQTLCLGSVSFLFAFRLWAWYEVSARVLYALLLVWAVSLLTTLALVINLAGFRSQEIMHEPFLNICISVAPGIWLQWLPATIEHAIYAVFLIFNAMGTPRSERKAALAIIYRDGIHFYLLSFFVCLIALLIWGVAPKPYQGFGFFPPWMVFQVGISRLLLNVRTSQIFAAQGRATVDEETYLGREIPLREVASQQDVLSQQEQERDTDRASCFLISGDEEAKMVSPSSFSALRAEYDGKEWTRGWNDANGVRREIRRIQPNTGSLMKRFWWMQRSEIGDIHIDVMHEDNQGDEFGETSPGGVKLSRLGRLDDWL